MDMTLEELFRKMQVMYEEHQELTANQDTWPWRIESS